MAQPRPAFDPTVYPTDDGMGENTLETLLRELLRPLIARFLAARGTPAFVGGNQFIYWKQHEPTASVAPDVYVLPALAPDAEPSCIKTWELGRGGAPSFALEIVSSVKVKDYVRAPLRYDELGARELVVYDPAFASRREGRKLQVYRRLKGRGLRLVEATDGDRVESRALGCFLREVEEGGSVRLRLGVGREGGVLFLTEAEAERAAKEAERAAKEAAEARVRELEARLEQLEGKRGR